MSVTGIIYLFCTGCPAIFFLVSAVTSIIEKEKRAALILFFSSMMFSILFSLPLLLDIEMALFQIIISACFFLLLAVFLIPFRQREKTVQSEPKSGFHEEVAVLSRRLLLPDTPAYDEYYRTHPEYKHQDDLSREKPGLLSDEGRYFNLASFHSARANFMLSDHLHQMEEIKPSGTRIAVDKKKAAAYIIWWMKQSGARDIAFTETKDYHFYSFKGRGPRKGERIVNDLPQAIAITVEMDRELMKYAPAGPGVMESSRKYLDSGILATKLAIFIKSLGYEARAHIDGNYEVICPLVAADAGLGVIGRMGLLMTPDLGPRVRISVVTTDLPLEYERRQVDQSPMDFCGICRKCADNCPAKAIPFDERKEIEGVSRWRIDSERCYHFWTIAGTDCGLCMSTCPYSHPDNWFHRLIRWGIKNNLLFRRMAAKLDDVFYGRKPAKQQLPDELTLDHNL